MNGGEGTRTRSLLSNLGVSGWFCEHSSLSDEDDVSVGELLLELTGEPD